MEILSFIPAINKCNVTDMLQAKLCYLQLPVNGHSINQRIWEAVVQIMCKHTHVRTHTRTHPRRCHAAYESKPQPNWQRELNYYGDAFQT